MRFSLPLACFFCACFSAAAFGAQFAPGEWYAALNKPAWNPPNWLFGPAWTLLYSLMAISGWLIWKQRGLKPSRIALGLFAFQLILNAAWSWLFFGLHAPAVALIEISILWIAILATIIQFWRVRPLAGALLLPYLGWVGFATMLNAAIWRLNG